MSLSGFIGDKPVTLENGQLVSINPLFDAKIEFVELTSRDISYATRILKISASSSLLSVKMLISSLSAGA